MNWICISLWICIWKKINKKKINKKPKEFSLEFIFIMIIIFFFFSPPFFFFWLFLFSENILTIFRQFENKKTMNQVTFLVARFKNFYWLKICCQNRKKGFFFSSKKNGQTFRKKRLKRLFRTINPIFL